MRVYHGSTVCVPEPRVLSATRRLDFGSGFYTTSDLSQARRWAQVKKRRLLAAHAMVSAFDATAALTSGRLPVRRYETANDEWLDFVMANRMGDTPPVGGYDVIWGPVANDTLYETLALYERGILTRAETSIRLRTQSLADQIVFATTQALALLHYESCAEVAE